RARTTQFILDHVRDLHVCVVYRNVAGLLVQRLKFTGPDGNVYHVLGAPFATPGVAVPAQGVDVDGVLRPVKRTQRVVADGLSVRDVLPVAGTAIKQYRLVGHWSVEISLNGRVLDREEFVIKVRR